MSYLFLGAIAITILIIVGQRARAKSAPWAGRPSIYAHISANIAAVGLTEEGQRLPDDDVFYAGKQLRWIAGGMDGAFAHHGGAGQDDQIAERVFSSLQACANTSSAAARVTFYGLIQNESVISFLDSLLQKVIASQTFHQGRLYEFGQWLAKEAPDRGAVKFGVSLLGLFGKPEDLETFRIVGRHEEFTLYCAVAITNTVSPPDRELWGLSKHVTGWGRIQLVERLSATQDPEIQEWLLLDGFKNSIMYEYSAYICATAGELRKKLDVESPSKNLIMATGEILDALIAGGPAQDISNYADAIPVVSRYLDLIPNHAETLTDILPVLSVYGFVNDKERDWSKLHDGAWLPDVRSHISSAALAILSEGKWKAMAISYKDDDDDMRYYALMCFSKHYDIPLWEAHWSRLQRKPSDSGRWFHVMNSVASEKLEEVLDYGEKYLPLETLASGPANEMGLGQEFNQHSILDFILQGLTSHPGHGWPFIRSGLRSPVIRNRNMALNALEKWPRNTWPSDADSMLRAALREDPTTDVRDRIAKIVELGIPEEIV